MKNSVIRLFGLQIRLERVKNGYSQSDLAELSGLHRTYISSVERGGINISLSNCLRISDALKIKLSDLIRNAEACSPVES